MALARFSHVGVTLPMVTLTVSMVALVSGHPAIAEFAGGVVLVWLAWTAGSWLTRLAAWEADPDRELVLDVLLVLVVVLGLVGVTLIGLTLPHPG